MIGRHRRIVYAILATWQNDHMYPDSQRQGEFVVSFLVLECDVSPYRPSHGAA